MSKLSVLVLNLTFWHKQDPVLKACHEQPPNPVLFCDCFVKIYRIPTLMNGAESNPKAVVADENLHYLIAFRITMEAYFWVCVRKFPES